MSVSHSIFIQISRFLIRFVGNLIENRLPVRNRLQPVCNRQKRPVACGFLIQKMKKPDHRSCCNRLQSGPVPVFFPVARPDLETLHVSHSPPDFRLFIRKLIQSESEVSLTSVYKVFAGSPASVVRLGKRGSQL